MPGGRGSSPAASVLAEMIRTGTAPAAIVLGTADPILTVGAIVAESLYGLTCPIALCATDASGPAIACESPQPAMARPR